MVRKWTFAGIVVALTLAAGMVTGWLQTASGSQAEALPLVCGGDPPPAAPGCRCLL